MVDGPPWPGPIFIYRNIVTSSPLLDHLWPTHTPGCFKIGARNTKTPDRPGAAKPAMTNEGARVMAAPGAGFVVFNNTIVFPYGWLLTTPMPIEGEHAKTLANFHFVNNIFLSSGFHANTNWQGGALEFAANLSLDRNPVPRHQGLAAGKNGLRLTDAAAVRFEDAAGNDYRLKAGSPALGHGIAGIDEVDASPDLGAIPGGVEWQQSAGPSAGISEAGLSDFQRMTRYEPQFLRTAGPKPGLWGIALKERQSSVSLKAPSNLSQGGTVTLVFRTTGMGHTNDLLSMDGWFSVAIREDGAACRLVWSREGAHSAVASANLPPWPAARWQQLRFDWDAEGRLSATLNAKDLPLAAGVTLGRPVGAVDNLTVTIARNPVADVTVATVR